MAVGKLGIVPQLLAIEAKPPTICFCGLRAKIGNIEKKDRWPGLGRCSDFYVFS
jgi:hypothetical protein